MGPITGSEAMLGLGTHDPLKVACIKPQAMAAQRTAALQAHALPGPQAANEERAVNRAISAKLYP